MSSFASIAFHFFLQCIMIAPAVVCVVELMVRLPLRASMNGLTHYPPKALHLILSSKISDHWKEKVLPVYAGKIMRASLVLALGMGLLLFVFVALFFVCGMLRYSGDISRVWDALLTLSTQCLALIIGGLYWAFRRASQASSKSEPLSSARGYSMFSKAFHYLALNSRAVRESAFDIDCIFSGLGKKEREVHMPVYVMGLARSGTTILLEALFSTGKFATLTYRDMPFVTAPILWRKLVQGRGIEGDLRERAHGDRLLVNYDSPEAFEEVFWKTVSDDRYILDTHLEPQTVEPEWVEKYRIYVSHIVSSWKGEQRPRNEKAATHHEKMPKKEDGRGDGEREHCENPFPFRYLAKNNNNLLRINMLGSAFPDAKMVVVFRNPMDHANSLLKQHLQFIEYHTNDPFGRRYMNWLGHHEFGLDMKPFLFAEAALLKNEMEADALSYWLRYWTVVYSYLLTDHGKDLLFFDYDLFCEAPNESLVALSEVLELPDDALLPFAEKVKSASRYEKDRSDTLPVDAQVLHEQLQRLALNGSMGDV